jgi:hypothetical protein
VSYRNKLIDVLKENIEPFAVTESNITQYRRSIEEEERTTHEPAQPRDRLAPCRLM